MSSFTLTLTLDRPYTEAVEAVRGALAEQGFGILTEIDLKATLKDKIDVDVAPQVILGACRPALAYEALTVEPSIAAVLPCNVVVRRGNGDGQTTVEAIDPQTMVQLSGSPQVREIADDADARLRAALSTSSEADPTRS